MIYRTLPNKGFRWSEIQRNHQREAQRRRYELEPSTLTGTHLPDEWRANISKALKEYYKDHDGWNRGIPIHSKETRRRISESCKKSGVGKFNKHKKRNKKEGGGDNITK